MDSVIDLCREELVGWYDSIDRLRVGGVLDKLMRQGVPYMEAGRASDPAVQAWLEPLYAAGPRAGSVVAVVRTIEGVSSFSCRPRMHTRAKGDPKTGRRPTETAEHHLTRARHNIRVYSFYVFDAHWGRACVRLSSYLPFEITLQWNGHDYLERQLHRQRREITMASNAVAKVADWEALRAWRGLPSSPRSVASGHTGWPVSPTV